MQNGKIYLSRDILVIFIINLMCFVINNISFENIHKIVTRKALEIYEATFIVMKWKQIFLSTSN